MFNNRKGFKEGSHFNIRTEIGGLVEIDFMIQEIAGDFATVRERYHNEPLNQSKEAVHICKIEHLQNEDVIKVYNRNELRIELHATNMSEHLDIQPHIPDAEIEERL